LVRSGEELKRLLRLTGFTQCHAVNVSIARHVAAQLRRPG
jgi:hypothetical protein